MQSSSQTLIRSLPLSQVVRQIREGVLQPVDLIHDLCDRIDLHDHVIFSFLPEAGRRGRLLSNLEELYVTYPLAASRPPLFGVPVGVKDIFRVDGFETRAGSRLPAFEFAGEESSVVTTLKMAGALILGKTVSTEFAYFQPGPTRNPYHLGHTPGGSSSGSAAAVAAGMAPLALGTQTIGSISRPASYCGVYGFKPGFGRISTDGLVPFSPSADHVGFFTQDMEGIELVCRALVNDWSSYPVSDAYIPVLGIPTGKYQEQVEPQTLQWFKEVIRGYKESGYTIVEADVFGDITEINKAHKQIVAREFAAVHGHWFAKHGPLYGRHSRALVLEGRKVSDRDLESAMVLKNSLLQHFRQFSESNGIDVWLSPASAGTAPAGLDSTGSPLMNLPWTYMGVPTLSIPAGKEKSGLPRGLQAAGLLGHDEKLIACCKRLSLLQG
ncbi:MAG: amidase [Bacteroidia bacterium]|nr:MAG: amidase [Bacteroidia bacterium]